MTKIIGLTGGIGSGKSTVAAMFIKQGYPVYIADEEAKKVLQLPQVIDQIQTQFGKQTVSNGIIDKKELAKIVFNNPQQLHALNTIIHPLLKVHFEQWVKNHHAYKFVIKETAILFESESYKQCDLIITVITPLELRIQRVMQRDQTTRQEVMSRIKNQWTDEQRLAKSNYIIHNDNQTNRNADFFKIIDILKKY